MEIYSGYDGTEQHVTNQYWEVPEFNVPTNAYRYTTTILRMSTNSVRFGSRFLADVLRSVEIS